MFEASIGMLVALHFLWLTIFGLSLCLFMYGLNELIENMFENKIALVIKDLYCDLVIFSYFINQRVKFIIKLI